EVAARYLAGESAHAIAEDLNDRGVPLPTGAEWTYIRVRRMLTNPAYAGLRVYRGEVIGDAGWEPILDRRPFDALMAKFEPRRGRRGGDVRHLLSGIARCGRCGGPMYVGHDRGRLVYTCGTHPGHLTRSKTHVDAYVTAVLLERLASEDFDD